MKDTDLIQLAKSAQKKAYAPYSNYYVGAALLASSGRVYCGCNIENASYSATMCAERVALFQAVSAGERSFEALAVVGGTEGERFDFCTPCGMCLQTLSEFLDENCKILLLDENGNLLYYAFQDFLPHNFTKEHLTATAQAEDRD